MCAQMFPRFVYQSCNGKTTSWILVNNNDEQVQAIDSGWSSNIPAALESYNNPKSVTESVAQVAPKKRGRPAKEKNVEQVEK